MGCPVYWQGERRIVLVVQSEGTGFRFDEDQASVLAERH